MLVKSAERVLEIIDHLSVSEEGAGLTELSKELGIPKSSMSQLLKTMVDRNYLIKSDANLYKLGHKLIIAGNKARTSNDVYSAANSILRETVGRTGETLFLAIRSSDEIIYLAKVDSDNSPRTTAQPGMRKPLHCTGLGKAFLSFEEPFVRENLLETISLEQYTQYTITDRSELRRLTDEYRKHGYAVDDEENDIGVYCISAPIYNDEHRMIAAISCAGTKSRMLDKQESIAREMIRAAGEISETQGFTGGGQ